jgi:hypothetical protein
VRFDRLLACLASSLTGLCLATSAPWAIAQQGPPAVAPVRREIVIGLPEPKVGPGGEFVVDPNVQLMGCEACGTTPPRAGNASRAARRPTMERISGPALAARPASVVQGPVPQTQLLPPGASAGPVVETVPLGPQSAPPPPQAMPPGSPYGSPGPQYAPPGQPYGPPGPQYATPGPQQYAPQQYGPHGEFLPPPSDGVLNQPLAGDWVATNDAVPFSSTPCDDCRERRTYLYWSKNKDGEPGIGQERVMLAPFAIDITQPLNNFRMRFDGAIGQRNPDRLEYFWPRAGVLNGKGPPLVENKINYQEYRMLFEIGSKKASVLTEVPFRFVDPQFNDNVGGLGDVSIAPKLVLMDGACWQISQLFRTYFASGSPHKGLGTGHISIEPNFLFRYRWSAITYLHAQIKYWAPLGGDPIYAHPVLGYGFGLSHVLYESDTFALLPTLEFLGSDLQSGQQSALPAIMQNVQHMGIINFQPGMRVVKDYGGDLGLFELGFSGGVPLTGSHWYGSLLRIDLRWSW